MKTYLLIIGGAVALSIASSCNKIEDVNRSVVVAITHPSDIDYHINLGVNGTQNVASWDTTGPINVNIDGQVGDAVNYGISTDAPGCGLSVTVDGVEKVHLDLSGTAPNVGNGYLILE
ncbi:MAG: hypothetical protein GC178_14315 [Flavobacteriales bacterium]|nr:hypothetical protein [Flavobacteriales bacterium]